MADLTYDFRPVDSSFLETAPTIYQCICTTPLPRADVWKAFSGAETWPDWFPQCDRIAYEGKMPPGVGTVRRSWFGDVIFEETMLIWEEGSRWGYRIDKANLKIAEAQLELTEFEDLPDGGTRVIWTMASEPTDQLNHFAADKTVSFEDFMKDMLDTALSQLAQTLRSEAQP